MIETLLDQTLDEQVALRLANQVVALGQMQGAIEEGLAPETATDLQALIQSLERFTRQFPVWREFMSEAAIFPPLSPEQHEALHAIAATLQEQPNSIVAPNLKEAIAEVEPDSAPTTNRTGQLAFVRAVSNPLKAIAHYFIKRARGSGVEFNKALEREIGKGLASGLLTVFMAVSTPLLSLALQLPNEFAWVGPILAAVRLAKQ